MGTNEQRKTAGHVAQGGSDSMQGLDRVVPDEIASLFEQPSLLPGEDPQAYSRLLTAVGVAVDPKDVIEWLWVKDVVALLWEAQRLRRIRVALLAVNRRNALDEVLKEH